MMLVVLYAVQCQIHDMSISVAHSQWHSEEAQLPDIIWCIHLGTTSIQTCHRTANYGMHNPGLGMGLF